MQLKKFVQFGNEYLAVSFFITTTQEDKKMHLKLGKKLNVFVVKKKCA